VLASTWSNLEVIAVNDGSTDGSGRILDSYTNRGVVVVHQENKGQCAAANRAFAVCQGDYIKFFDSDDLLSPEMIELQMTRLNGSTTAVASAEWGRFYGDDIGTFRLNPQAVWRDLGALDWLVESWMDARPMMQAALWLIPRPVLERSGLWDEGLSLINDFEFFARVLCNASDVRFTPGAPLYYRSGLQNSLSGRKDREAVESAFNSLMAGTSHVLALRSDAAAHRACANVLQDFIYTYYPEHRDLMAKISRRVHELGGADLAPSGPPRFEQLRRVVGWKIARRIQRLAGR
jgi:glycosyltransferase involved in cell wall biosynthesis